MGRPSETTTGAAENPPTTNGIPEPVGRQAISDKIVGAIQSDAWKYATTQSLKLIRRALIIAVGSTVLAFGVVLLVLPGPAIVVIPTGLAILALEFAWARSWLRKSKRILEDPKAELKRLNPFNNKHPPGGNGPEN